MGTMINRRRVCGGESLPYDAEIEYLESTGTQWIDTCIIMNTRNIECEIKMKWTGITASDFESFFAFMINDGIIPRSGLHKYQGKWMFGTNTTNKTGINVDNSIHTFMISGNASSNRETLFVDGVSIEPKTTVPDRLSNNTMPFFAFARNRNGSIDNAAKCRIYSIKYRIYDDGQHIYLREEHNLMPVRVGRVGYLYDKVSGQLFGNAGTGEFILGPDK